MTTQKQIEANRRNSRRSTGPKTRTGKAESKMNAMKHGLLAADLVVRDEDPVEFARVLESLVDELQPQGSLEEQLVERVAVCMWRLRRLYRVEAGIFNFEIMTIEFNYASREVVQEEAGTLGAAFRRDANYPGAISKLSRYEAAIERSLHRAALSRRNRWPLSRRNRWPLSSECAAAPTISKNPTNLGRPWAY